jgi:hypothetical protein
MEAISNISNVWNLTQNIITFHRQTHANSDFEACSNVSNVPFCVVVTFK